MSDNNDSLAAAFARLDAERAASWPPAQHAANIAQRRALVERFDPERTVRIGDRLSGAELLDLDGALLSLDASIADGPAVLIFFRFATCGADVVALPHYDRRLRPALARLGVPVFAISPQVPERLGQIVAAHGLELTMASDSDSRLARRLGIVFAPDEQPSPPPASWIGAVTGTRSWELPMPTVLVLDRDRVVRFVAISPDWLDRPEASTILAAVAAVRDGDAAIVDRDAA